MAPGPAFAGEKAVLGAVAAEPVPVSTVPPSQMKKELEIDEDLLVWMIETAKQIGDYHAWADKVTLNDRVVSNVDLITAILASDSFYQNLLKM